MSAIRSMVRLTGCRPPRPASIPGSVTSTVSDARRASSAAVSSSALRRARAAETVSRTSLIAAPAALRSSGGSLPSCLSWPVMLPDLPTSDTRSASMAAGDSAAAMSASARVVKPWMSFIRARSVRHSKNENGEGLAPFPMRVLQCPCAAGRGEPRPAGTGYLRRERALGLLGQRGKPGCIVHGDVRQHLAVERDAGLHQSVHEAAVAHAVHPGSRVDAGDPQRTEVALLVLAVDVGVLLRLDDRLLGDAEYLATRVVVTLRLGEDLLVTTECLHATHYSCHFSVLLWRTAACGSGGRHPRRGRGSSAAGCASAWSPSW